MCACRARVSAEKSDTNRGNGAEWWVCIVSFLSRRWDKAHNISIRAYSHNIFTHRRCLRMKFTNRFPKYGFQTNLERDWALWATWFEVRVEFSKSWSEQSKRKVYDSNLENILFTSVKRGFPVKSSLQTVLVLICLLKNRWHEPVECMNVEFARHAVKFSHTFSDFVDVRCRERAGILLSGSESFWEVRIVKKPDRLAANQSARFARIPDRKKNK